MVCFAGNRMNGAMKGYKTEIVEIHEKIDEFGKMQSGLSVVDELTKNSERCRFEIFWNCGLGFHSWSLPLRVKVDKRLRRQNANGMGEGKNYRRIQLDVW